jgi:hypothetical protein
MIRDFSWKSASTIRKEEKENLAVPRAEKPRDVRRQCRAKRSTSRDEWVAQNEGVGRLCYLLALPDHHFIQCCDPSAASEQEGRKKRREDVRDGFVG